MPKSARLIGIRCSIGAPRKDVGSGSASPVLGTSFAVPSKVRISVEYPGGQWTRCLSQSSCWLPAGATRVLRLAITRPEGLRTPDDLEQ
jgi:hypothetical protein